jgi:two-component system NarL family response regulator
MTRPEIADASDAIWPGFVKPDARAFRFVLIDDHPVVRDGIGALLSLESDMIMVGDTGDLDTGIELVRRFNPDLVVCDLMMPHCLGATAVRRLCSEFRSVHVLVLTALDSLESMRDSFAAGAIGYVRKDAFRVDLLWAVRAAASGYRVVCRGTAEMLTRSWLLEPSAQASSRKPLGPEDQQILRSIALGVPTRQIAVDLGRGMKLMGKHRAQLMRRLNLPSTAAVTRYAVGCNLVSLEEIKESRQKDDDMSSLSVPARRSSDAPRRQPVGEAR